MSQARILLIDDDEDEFILLRELFSLPRGHGLQCDRVAAAEIERARQTEHVVSMERQTLNRGRPIAGRTGGQNHLIVGQPGPPNFRSIEASARQQQSGIQRVAGFEHAVTGHVEKQGIGMIQNNQKYHVYAPKIYDDVNGYWLFFYLHNAKFVDAWTLDMKYGASWELTKVVLRAYALTSMPTSMRFGTIFRIDPSQV